VDADGVYGEEAFINVFISISKFIIQCFNMILAIFAAQRS